MVEEIRKNLVFLTENITNLTKILVHLVQHEIISEVEKEEIEAEKTSYTKNGKLLSLIQKKDWQEKKNLFLEILKKTNNSHCAMSIEEDGNNLQATAGPSFDERKLFEDRHLRVNSLKRRDKIKSMVLHPRISKWWPDEKQLIKSLHKRKIGSKYLVEELHERIMKDDNRMIVICESADASKYSGMGGVGKTLTAKWYGHRYEEEYDYILWIDCGEGRLKESFESLARDLKIEDRKELVKVEDYSRKCYEQLMKWKCLWIFDNAESYKGDEGIITVLPRNKENFSCVITSRSREWGVENVGFGKISDLQLDIFSEQESLEFLKERLDKKIKYEDFQLKKLCLLLGYLPLALQLALSALNSNKIDLKSYIEKTRCKDLENIVDTEFDDYEKTINKNIKISLDLILKEENGKLAHEIVMIFGYIRPDNIPQEFIGQIVNSGEIENAMELLIKYCLISKEDKSIQRIDSDQSVDKEIKIFLSIHRLLQQVIRHNGRERKTETLRKILGCNGFVDYKLIPFTKYADEELRKEFPNVKAELLDQEQLRKLIREERFEESVQLAKFIHKELKTKATKLNYAICLAKNKQMEEYLKTLEELFIKRKTNENDLSRALEKMLEYITTNKLKINVEQDLKLVKLKEEPTEIDIGTILFYYYLRMEKIEDTLAVGKQIANNTQILTILCLLLREMKFKDCVQLAKVIDDELWTMTTQFNYAICLQKNGQLEECINTLEELSEDEMEEEFEYDEKAVEMGIIRLDRAVGRDLVFGQLLVLYWRMKNKERVQQILEERKKFQIIPSEDSLGILIQIVSSDLMNCKNYLLAYDTVLIGLHLKTTTKKIYLWKCWLSLSSFHKISAEELYLRDILFTRDGEELKEVTVNEFIDFSNIKRLTLICDDYDNMLIDLKSEDVSMEYVWLWGVKVLDWNVAKWNIQRLELWAISFVEKTKMNIKEMNICRTSLDISCLPRNIQLLTLDGYEVEVFVSGGINLPLLKYLTLSFVDSSSLSHFSSIQLTHIHFKDIQEVNLSHLPTSVTQLKIWNRNTRIVGGTRKLDKVILEEFSFEWVEECLSHLHTDNLVVGKHRYCGFGSGFSPRELLEFMKMEINTIAVGEINWGQELEQQNFKIISSHVDRKADYYFLERGQQDRKSFFRRLLRAVGKLSVAKGRGMEEEEFNKYLQLY